MGQKNKPATVVHIFAKYRPIYQIILLARYVENLQNAMMA